MDGNRQVVVNEMSGCREVQIPLEGFQQEQLHVKQTLFGQDQVHGAHAAQAVQGLQLGHPVLPFLKFACNEEQNITAHRGRTVACWTARSVPNLLAKRRHDSETM